MSPRATSAARLALLLILGGAVSPRAVAGQTGQTQFQHASTTPPMQAQPPAPSAQTQAKSQSQTQTQTQTQAQKTRPQPAPPPQAKPSPPPLSAEDAALVRELSLVENAELLQHLELFDAQAQTDQSRDAHAEPPARTQ